MSSHTPGPWRFGKPSDSVVSDAPDTRTESHVDYYGGNLIAESISPSNRPIIAAAPELLDMVRRYASECGECNGTGMVTLTTWVGGIEVSNDDQLCPDCADIRALIAKATGANA